MHKDLKTLSTPSKTYVSTATQGMPKVSPVVTSTIGTKVKARVSPAKPVTVKVKNSVENNTGARTYDIGKVNQFKRFLILGISGGTYYTPALQHFKNNSSNISKVFDAIGVQAVDIIREISREGLATSNEPAIYALSVGIGHSDVNVRRASADALSAVCRTGTHLYHFMSYLTRGGGRILQRGLGNWFTEKKVTSLAYTLTKYQSRDGWSARDVLRVARPTAPSDDYNQLFKYITQGTLPTSESLSIINDIKNLNESNVISTIEKHNLSLEQVPNNLHSKEVYQSILMNKPGLTWVIRNLPTMTRLGLFDSVSSPAVKRINELLTSQEELNRARIHPLNVAIALYTYKSGRSLRGSSTWVPNRAILANLELCLGLAFKAIEPTGKSFKLGLDCSGSMDWQTHFNVPDIKTRTVAAIMALGLVNSETNVDVYGFGSTLQKLNITKASSLSDTIQATNINFGSTNIGLLIEDSLKKKEKIDVFVVMTDNEVNSGYNVSHLLRQYRQEVNPGAKLVVCAMTATRFSVADPNDAGMLDIPGETADLPKIISTFASLDL